MDKPRNSNPLTRLIIRPENLNPLKCQHLPPESLTLGRYRKIFKHYIRRYYEDRTGSEFYFSTAGVSAVDDSNPDFVTRGRSFTAYNFRIFSGAHLYSYLGLV